MTQLFLPNHLRVVLVKAELSQGHDMTLTSDHLRLESMIPAEPLKKTNHLLKKYAFEILADNETSCLIVRKPFSGNKFTYDDVLNEKIVISVS